MVPYWVGNIRCKRVAQDGRLLAAPNYLSVGQIVRRQSF